MEPFALVEDVQRRLDFALDTAEHAAVQAALEDMSSEARYYGNRAWPDPSATPNIVRATVIKAVARWARNMNGYVTSRAGDETLSWSDVGPEAGAPEFLPKEIKLLKAIGDGRAGAFSIGSAEVVAYDPSYRNIDDGRIHIAGRDSSAPGDGPANPLIDSGKVGTSGGGLDPFPFNLPDGAVW